MGKFAKVAWASALVAGAAGVVCAMVAPRSRDEALRDQWEAISRYRYAHRGLYDNRTPAPENSLPAFRFARDWGYGSELDVHLTADDELVVIHDSKLRRATGVDAVVEDLTLAELQKLRLFGTNERIPTLGQVLDIYQNGQGVCPPLVVELKTHAGNHAQLTARAMEELDAHTVPYCVESFDPRVPLWLRKNRPEVIRGQLSEQFVLDKGSDMGFFTGLLHGSLLINVVSRPDFVAYRFEHRHHPGMLLACGALGAWSVYWTVGSVGDLEKADLKDAVSIFEGFMPEPVRSTMENLDSTRAVAPQTSGDVSE